MEHSKPGPPSARKAIEDEYEVESGIIRSPGKFEGEPVYMPYFYEAFMNGLSDSEEDDISWFDVNDEDKLEFPELTTFARVGMWEDNEGFVHSICQ